MTYGGVPHVIGHPPHFAMQYDLPASINTVRATTSPGFLNTCTLGGRVSLTSFLSNFPCAQRFQYGFGIYAPPVVAPPDTSVKGHDSDAHSNSRFHRYVRFILRGKRQKARLQPRSPRPIGSFLKSACKRPQLLSRLSWLSSSFRLQADGRSLVFVGVNPISCTEVIADYVAHSSVFQVSPPAEASSK